MKLMKQTVPKVRDILGAFYFRGGRREVWGVLSGGSETD